MMMMIMMMMMMMMGRKSIPIVTISTGLYRESWWGEVGKAHLAETCNT